MQYNRYSNLNAMIQVGRSATILECEEYNMEFRATFMLFGFQIQANQIKQAE